MPHPTTNKTLKQKFIWHLRVLFGSLAISLIFGLALLHNIPIVNFIVMVIITVVQLEIFMWIQFNLFRSLDNNNKNYAKQLVGRLLLFYVIVLCIAFFTFLCLFTFYFAKSGASFALFYNSFVHSDLKEFFIALAVGLGIGSIVFFYAEWIKSIKHIHKLKEEKLLFQYETLKSQVNPHFLFNSLNVLSSVIASNPALSEQFIQKLSSVYRYVIDNQDKNLVPLLEEIEFVKKFFFLQKIRDEEKIELKLDIRNDSEVCVLPVSVQLLVENALKHNAATRKDPLLVTVHLEGIDKLVVRNDIRHKTQLKESARTGLKNLNARCELILGRKIEVTETMDEFIVKIPVKTKVK